MASPLITAAEHRPKTERDVNQPSLLDPRRALVVLGMHRSGTSAAARVLSLLGARLPTNLLAPEADQNPSGFWESEDIIAFNDEVLRSLRSRWDDMLGLRLCYAPELDRPELIGRAASLIERAFGQTGPIVLKDPRISILLPLWRRALVDAGYDPAYILVLRNPLETAESLARRNGFPQRKSLLLWSSYTLAAERFTRGEPRAVLRYADLLADWRAQLPLFRNWLSANVEDRDSETDQQIDRFLRPELRHHVVPDDALANQLESVPLVGSVYESMAALDQENSRQALDDAGRRVLEAAELLGEFLVQREMELQDLTLQMGGSAGQGTASPTPEKSEKLATAAAHWSKPPTGPARTRWWQSALIVSHINRNYCGKAVLGTDGGDIELLRTIGGGQSFDRAVSVGCGAAYHELRLLQEGVVAGFDLYEISEARADAALSKAQSLGLADRIDIRLIDAFSEPPVERYDLVYWKDALHHMFDAAQAVRWSRQVLRPGGAFFMNEFVGPTLMQYTERQLDLAERARGALPERYLANPHRPGETVPMRRARPDPARMAEVDPSECADSSNILPAVTSAFHDAVVIPTGGVVYALALNDILANLDESEDEALLRTLMLADDLCIEAGETLYAVAYARKPLQSAVS
jgi:SAM-dependent methyltransferase